MEQFCMRNILFFKEGEVIPHTHPDLEFADCVSITFECQERGKAQHGHTGIIGGFSTLSCAVCCRPGPAHLVLQREGFKHPGLRLHQKRHSQACDFNTGHQCTVQLVGAIGVTCLGISKQEMGTHSIRSGVAMVMYLGKCPVYTIMLIGWWSSDAFLHYIHKQVMQFSHNVSKKMLHFKNYQHVPNYDHRIAANDPRVRNDSNNAETRRNISGDASQHNKLSAFTQFN
jgi:hypothetical protein